MLLTVLNLSLLQTTETKEKTIFRAFFEVEGLPEIRQQFAGHGGLSGN